MSTVVLRGNYPDLYDLAITAGNMAVMDFEQWPAVYDQIFRVIDSTKKDEKVSALGGFNTLDEVGEGEDTPSKAPVQGYDKTFTHTKYADFIGITRESWEDDPKGVINNQPTLSLMFAQAAMQRVEVTTSAILNAAFTSATSPDGQYICDSDHPTSPENATTLSNVINTKLDAKGAAIDTMWQKIADNCKNMAGQTITIPRWKLVVPPALKMNALTSINAIYGNGTTSNPQPVQTGELVGPVSVVVNPYMSAANGGSDTAWFMIADPTITPNHSLAYFWRKRLAFDPLRINDDNTNFELYGEMRFSCGARDWRHVWGSTGTA